MDNRGRRGGKNLMDYYASGNKSGEENSNLYNLDG